MTATTTIRVTPDTRERLKRIGRKRGVSTPQLLDSLSRRAEEDELLADHEAALQRIMSDPKQAAASKAELQAWDTALKDGLNDA